MGKSRVENPEGFIADLRELEKRRRHEGYVASVRARCLGELSRLSTARFTKAGSVEPQYGLSLTSKRRAISRYRNAIREAFGEKHIALRWMRLTDKKQNEYHADDRKKIVAAHNARRPLDVDRHVSIARTVLEKLANEPLVVPTDRRGTTLRGYVSPLEAAAAVIAVTGRRPSEVLRDTAPLPESGFDFALVPKVAADLFDAGIRPQYHWAVLFSGQRKTRGSDAARLEPYQIPVLVEPELVLAAIARIRARFPVQDLTDVQVQDKAGKNVGKYAKGEFQEQIAPGYRDRGGDPLSPKDLRAAYATCVYEKYAPRSLSWNAYTSRVLGHSANDLLTSMSYDEFYPYGAARPYREEVAASAREAIASLERQRDFTDDDGARAKIDADIAAIRSKLMD